MFGINYLKLKKEILCVILITTHTYIKKATIR